MKTINFLKILTVMTFPLLIAGCIVPNEHASRGVKLSDAMDASAKGDERNLGGNNSYSPTPDAVAAVAAAATEMAGASYNSAEYFWQVPADVSYSRPFNGEIRGITHFTLTPVCFEDERNFFGLYIGGAIVDLKSGSLPASAVDGMWMFETGLTYRRYLNSAHTAFSPYVAVSAGYLWLNWDYRNAIVSGGDIIHSDSLNGAESSVGFGISTRRDSPLSAFGEVDLGGAVFADTTNEGFGNDVFHNFGFVSVKAGLSLKF